VRLIATICDQLRRGKALALWPGLRLLWRDGSWRAVAVAVAFSACLNVLLAITLVWHEAAPAAVKWPAWCVLAVAWFVSAVVSWRGYAEHSDATPAKSCKDSSRDLYPAALNEYLKRNFVAAERLLVEQLAADSRDCAAGLLLATLWRRTDRAADARDELQRLARLETSEPWQLEIEQELSLLEPRSEETPKQDKSSHFHNQSQAA
jgi:hypothetical protein